VTVFWVEGALGSACADMSTSTNEEGGSEDRCLRE